MRTKSIFVSFIAAVILSSCISTVPTISVETAVSPAFTPTITFIPTLTPTSTPTITPSPTPIGGSILKTAFYAHDGKNQFLIVGDYFSGEEYYRIPIKRISTSTSTNSPSWAPDGKHLLFLDSWGDTTGNSMKVNLLNFDTGKIVTLGKFPALRDDVSYWNDLDYVRWSHDSKNVLYAPDYEEDFFTYAYISSVQDGTTLKLSGYYNDWLPDNKTLISYNNERTYNIETGMEDEIQLYAFKHLQIKKLFTSLILLDPYPINSIQGILYPNDLTDQTLWSLDILKQSKVDLVIFDPEIKVSKISNVITSREFSDGRIMLSVWGEFIVENTKYDKFIVLIDPANLPATVTKDLLSPAIPSTNGAVPILISPDLQFVLQGTLIKDESRSALGVSLDINYLPYLVRWQIADISGNIIREDDHFSQFNILNAPVYPGGDGGNNNFHGVDFYWQP